jgi:hypothetical protein
VLGWSPRSGNKYDPSVLERQVYLREGQTVRLGVEGLGEQSQTAIAWNA